MLFGTQTVFGQDLSFAKGIKSQVSKAEEPSSKPHSRAREHQIHPSKVFGGVFPNYRNYIPDEELLPCTFYNLCTIVRLNRLSIGTGSIFCTCAAIEGLHRCDQTTGVCDPDSRKLSTAPLTLSSDFHFHFTNDLRCQDNLKLPNGLCLVNEMCFRIF